MVIVYIDIERNLWTVSRAVFFLTSLSTCINLPIVKVCTKNLFRKNVIWRQCWNTTLLLTHVEWNCEYLKNRRDHLTAFALKYGRHCLNCFTFVFGYWLNMPKEKVFFYDVNISRRFDFSNKMFLIPKNVPNNINENYRNIESANK